MAKLIAQSTANPDDRWEHWLPSQPVTLGRIEGRCLWAAPWDNQISGLHAEVTWRDGKLVVRHLPEGRNKIFFRGQEAREFTVTPGEEFIIGRTTFSVEEGGSESGTPIVEMTLSTEELAKVAYADFPERIDVLASLPAVILHSDSEQALEAQVVDVLLRGIPRAEAAAVVRLDLNAPAGEVEVHSPRKRSKPRGQVRPSHRLVAEVIQRSREKKMHIWPPGVRHEEATVDPSFDWALCVPLPDDPLPGWGLYVAGKIARPTLGAEGPTQQELLASDLKFAELVAQIYGALRQVLALQRSKSMLSRFMSRPVLAALEERDMNEVLKPRQCEVTVLFCDLRGSCRIAEEGQHALAGAVGPRQRSAEHHGHQYHGPGRRRRRFPGGCHHGLLGLAPDG